MLAGHPGTATAGHPGTATATAGNSKWAGLTREQGRQMVMDMNIAEVEAELALMDQQDARRGEDLVLVAGREREEGVMEQDGQDDEMEGDEEGQVEEMNGEAEMMDGEEMGQEEVMNGEAEEDELMEMEDGEGDILEDDNIDEKDENAIGLEGELVKPTEGELYYGDQQGNEIYEIADDDDEEDEDSVRENEDDFAEDSTPSEAGSCLSDTGINNHGNHNNNNGGADEVDGLEGDEDDLEEDKV